MPPLQKSVKGSAGNTSRRTALAPLGLKRFRWCSCCWGGIDNCGSGVAGRLSWAGREITDPSGRRATAGNRGGSSRSGLNRVTPWKTRKPLGGESGEDNDVNRRSVN